jgi:hypothetical protein
MIVAAKLMALTFFQAWCDIRGGNPRLTLQQFEEQADELRRRIFP